jgi:tetratricopeptide (TPR) repeat protein
MLLSVGRVECPEIQQLHDLVAGGIQDAQREALLAHTDECAACHAAMIALVRGGATTAAIGPQPPLPSGVPATIDRYLVERRLGAGGMGVVFLAHDPELDRKVAVKLLRDARGADATERLRREARALAALSHPNVVAVHDVGEHDGQPFVAMEYVDAGSLRGWLGKPRTWREIVPVVIAAARGLAAAHAANLVHRDIKPENLLIGSDGRVRVSDFGLASVELPSDGSTPADSLTQTGAVMGTPAYMSPEQIDGEDTDPRSDQFSLCATAFEALYGKRPFAGKDLAQLAAAIDAGDIVDVPDAHVPAWLRRAIVRGLARKPADRWPSLDALCATLEAGMRRRARAIAAGVLGIAIASAALVAWTVAKPAARSCGHAADVPVAEWSPVRRVLLAAQFAAHGDGWTRIAPRLDTWFASWSEAATGACRDDEPAIAVKRAACFSWLLGDTGVLLERFVQGDSVDAATAQLLAERLPDLRRCSRAGVQGLPDVPAELVLRVPELERALIAADNPFDPAASLAKLPAIADAAQATHYAPLIARVELARGRWLDALGDRVGAERALRAAQVSGEASHDDRLVAESAVVIVHLLSQQAPLDDVRKAADYAHAALTRIGGDPMLEAELDTNVGIALRTADKVPEAIEELTKGCAEQRAATGPDSASYAICLTMLSSAYGAAKREADVARTLGEAKTILTTLYGDRGDLELINAAAAAQNRLLAGDVAGALALDERSLQRVRYVQPNGLLNGLIEYSLGLDHVLLDHEALALQHYERAVAIYTQLGQTDDRVENCLLELARIGILQGKTTEAVAWARRAVAIVQPRGNQLDMSLALAQLASALIAAGDAGGAREPAEQALALYEKTGAGAKWRGGVRFALAQALWSGDAADKRRALELAKSAIVDSRFSIEQLDARDALTPIYTRIKQRRIDAMEAWLRTHH